MDSTIGWATYTLFIYFVASPSANFQLPQILLFIDDKFVGGVVVDSPSTNGNFFQLCLSKAKYWWSIRNVSSNASRGVCACVCVSVYEWVEILSKKKCELCAIGLADWVDTQPKDSILHFSCAFIILARLWCFLAVAFDLVIYLLLHWLYAHGFKDVAHQQL